MWQFLRRLLFFYDLDSFEEFKSGIYKTFLTLDLSNDFPIILGLWILGWGGGGVPCGSAGEESARNVGDLGSIPGLEDPLEKGKATHSRILS